VTSSSVDVRRDMKALVDGQRGGVLATLGPDGGPHLVYVLCSVTDDLHVLFASFPYRDHSAHIEHNPRVACLFDTRERIDDPSRFHRLEVRGTAELVSPDHLDYSELQRLLVEKHPQVRTFFERGAVLFRIRPEVLTFTRGGSDKTVYRPGVDGLSEEPGR
jgi:hypothetical protein